MKDGKFHDKRCTLNIMSEILSETNIIRISRKYLVMPDAIVSYNDSFVNVHRGKNFPPAKIGIPRRHANEILLKIQSYKYVNTHEKSDDKVINHITNKQQARIYKYVCQHPDCTAKDIRKFVKTTPNTIYRHIARLKQQGLIEHVGANKTGGYRVVER